MPSATSSSSKVSSPPAAWRSSSPPRAGPSTRTPPPQHVCAAVNAQVTSIPGLAPPHFDFAEHVRSRSYTMQNFVFGDDPFETAVLLDEGVERLLPDTFQRACASPSCTFEIGDAGEKGRGMFAVKDMPAGALVLVEHPAVVVPYLIGLDVPLRDVYAELFGRLPPEAHRALMGLANSREDCDHREGIVRTNALGIQLDVPDVAHPELTTHRAVFLNTSRCNHSCGPNARWEWDTASFALYLSAVRPIQQGEEITIAYTACTRPRGERHSTLHAQYGFTCACTYCALPCAAASDAARVALARFWSDLPPFEAWCVDGRTPDEWLVKRHLEALRLIKQEGLQVLDAERHVDAIAMCYGALADVEMFRAWTERVREREARRVWVGVEGRERARRRALVFAKWLSNPASFPAWGWRRTFCVSKVEGEEEGKGEDVV
ncbi:putative SET (Su(var)3-9, Enhancer-of-zeste, Trithorax) domain containing protein [Lyophyllum shimeji]|uniref:SET (Su(Var)3-9, Enhancer-of-zeste, Trithorax) domain containing protein n=1 Tax=Lyophyllum shimeji TaxID=47721 RepID=A0A9P3USA9_LYOSH|nr:putative SET (Su(var)3-9, Enhancer-of-zeste, Trithorax) domain containing protein [Lyophyllum shimeji]